MLLYRVGASLALPTFATPDGVIVGSAKLPPTVDQLTGLAAQSAARYSIDLFQNDNRPAFAELFCRPNWALSMERMATSPRWARQTSSTDLYLQISMTKILSAAAVLIGVVMASFFDVQTILSSGNF